MRSLLVLLLATVLPLICGASFINHQHHQPKCGSSSLHLVPIASFTDPVKRTFLDAPDSFRTCIDENGQLRSDDDVGTPFVLSIAEEDDLPDISQLTINAFGADAITLSKNLSPIEQALISPGVGALNAYSGMVAYTEVLSGLRQRMMNNIGKGVDMKDLLAAPPVMHINDAEAEDVAAKSSVILALGRKKSGGNDGIDAIATVELRLQPTDAKIPISEPWFDKIERSIAKALNMNVQPKDMHLQPYLSNLCVDESVRGRQIGKAMCRCVEKIAKDTWGYEKIYLHVDLENVAALNLYKSEGYEDVGSRWNPFWAGQAAEIGYYYKNL